MQTASSAWRTWRESSSADEYTATVASPSSRQARTIRSAISPRLATRTLRNRVGLGRLESDDVLARVDQILVLDQEPRDPPLGVARDLVEALHDLDEPDHVARLDDVSLAHVRVGLRVRPPVERARQR